MSNNIDTIIGVALLVIAMSIIRVTPCMPQHGEISQPDPQMTSAPKFEVASIRPVKPGAGLAILRASNNAGGNFQVNGATVLLLIRMAYGVDFPQIVGGPPWIKSERYDIIAKADSALDDKLRGAGDDETRALKQRMLQALLADRFKLQVAHDAKVVPVYDLEILKNAPKLQTSNPQISVGPSFIVRRGELVSTQHSIASLVGFLAGQLRRPVRDQTGLKGKYDFTLKWDPSENSAGPLQNSMDSPAPSIFTAIQEQLGLRLVSTKGPVDFVIIDHIERPSEN